MTCSEIKKFKENVSSFFTKYLQISVDWRVIFLLVLYKTITTIIQKTSASISLSSSRVLFPFLKLSDKTILTISFFIKFWHLIYHTYHYIKAHFCMHYFASYLWEQKNRICSVPLDFDSQYNRTRTRIKLRICRLPVVDPSLLPALMSLPLKTHIWCSIFQDAISTSEISCLVHVSN